ncbi:hypothetical protein [uncultured Methanospirillum sp.]|nr:hypothetical protein [uncultured Methanospirillum sp.]
MRKPLIEWCKTTRCKCLVRDVQYGKQVWVCSVSGRRPRAMESCHKEQ